MNDVTRVIGWIKQILADVSFDYMNIYSTFSIGSSFFNVSNAAHELQLTRDLCMTVFIWIKKLIALPNLLLVILNLAYVKLARILFVTCLCIGLVYVK